MTTGRYTGVRLTIQRFVIEFEMSTLMSTVRGLIDIGTKVYTRIVERKIFPHEPSEKYKENCSIEFKFKLYIKSWYNFCA